MKPLEFAALIMLWSTRSTLKAAVPTDFNGLSEWVSDMQKDPDATMRKLLKAECGVEWSSGKPSEAIVAECLRQAGIERAIRDIDQKIISLSLARYRLRCPNIAGRDAVDEAVQVVEGET